MSEARPHWQTSRRPRPLADRFWEKVDRGPNCWLWTGAKTRAGYGAIGAGGKGGRMLAAHRLALTLSGVDVPVTALVCHRCDVRSCVRPSHLYVGTFSTNNRDTAARSAAFHVHHPQTGQNISAGLRRHHEANPATHCKRGHPFDEANTYWRGPRKRACRKCQADRMRTKRAS